MTDDEIRAVLRDLGDAGDGTPNGFVRVSAAELAKRADLRTVAVWIANEGGLAEPASADGAATDESFLVPLRALDGH